MFARVLLYSSLVALTAVLFSGLRSVSTAAPSQPSDTQIEANCRPFFGKACSEAMGRWIRSYEVSWIERRRATHLTTGDRFAYLPAKTAARRFDLGAPQDGTLFVYGRGGPPKGHAIYDRANHIAFYDDGCCSWHEVVAVAAMSAPPKPVTDRNLSRLHTIRGVALGQTPAQVAQFNGPAPLRQAPRFPGVTMMSYRWAETSSQDTHLYNGCADDENVYFENGRAVEIQIGWAC